MWLTIALLLLAYLTFAHPPMWIVYYLEVLPIFFFLAAREMGRLLHKLSGVGARSQRVRWPAPVANASLAVALLLLPLGANDVRRVRAAIDLRNSLQPRRRGRDRNPAAGEGDRVRQLSSVPEPTRGAHPQRARPRRRRCGGSCTIAGRRTPTLRALAPDRVAYRLDAATMRIERMP